MARLQEQLNHRVRWHDLYKEMPELIRDWMPDLESFRRTVIDGIPTQVIEPEDLGDPPPAVEARMMHHIEHIPILPKDAYLLAVAERLGVPHIATLDRDFRSALDWLSVYTIP
jgi:hypothetical protein